METIIDIIGFSAAICTTIAFLPQLIKTVKTRKADDISIYMYFLLVAGILLWLTYGLLMNAPPIIAANLVGLCLVLTILILKIKYK